MSNFKKNQPGHQNNMGNKPREFQEPHGTPMAPEGEKKHNNMNNQGGHNKHTTGNKSYNKPDNQKNDCSKGCCNCDCNDKNNCDCDCNNCDCK